MYSHLCWQGRAAWEVEEGWGVFLLITPPPLYLQPIDYNGLQNSDLMIMCSLRQTPLADPNTMIGEFCLTAGT